MNTRDGQIHEKFGRKRYDVFITYRRSDGLNYAQLLYQSLDKRGYKCFLDVRDQQDDEYEERIMAALHNAPNYIFLMTDGSLQRLSEEGNGVYIEVHKALSLHKKIIPVAPTGLSRGIYGAELLDEFNSLRALSVSRLETGEFFEESVDKIVQRFPVKIRRVRQSLVWVLVALVIMLSCMTVALWPKPHSSVESRNGKEEIGGKETNVIDKTVEPILKRMKEMRLPSISFKPPETMTDVVEFFRSMSKDYDRPDIPHEQRGFKFVLRQGKCETPFFDKDREDSFGEADLLPVVPQLSAHDISFYDALKLVCESVDYRFIVRNGEVIVQPKCMSIEPVETWVYEVDDEFEKILRSWFDKDATQKDDDLICGDGNDINRNNQIVMALAMHIGVAWYADSRVDYITAINRLRVTNAPTELRRIESFLSELKVLKSVRKAL